MESWRALRRPRRDDLQLQAFFFLYRQQNGHQRAVIGARPGNRNKPLRFHNIHPCDAPDHRFVLSGVEFRYLDNYVTIDLIGQRRRALTAPILLVTLARIDERHVPGKSSTVARLQFHDFGARHFIVVNLLNVSF